MAFQRDMLENKKRELELFTQQFEDAVSVVTDSIARLEAISEQTQKKIAEIEEYQAHLQETKDGLAKANDKNARIIQNFKSLLCE